MRSRYQTITGREKVLLSLLSYYPAQAFAKRDLVAGAGLPFTDMNIFRWAIPRLIEVRYIAKVVYNCRRLGYQITQLGLTICTEQRIKPFRGFNRDVWEKEMIVPK